MEIMEEGLELHILTKMGYVVEYGPTSLEDIISFAGKYHSDAITKILTQDNKLIYAGKISRLLKNIKELKNGYVHSN